MLQQRGLNLINIYDKSFDSSGNIWVYFQDRKDSVVNIVRRAYFVYMAMPEGLGLMHLIIVQHTQTHVLQILLIFLTDQEIAVI